MPTKRKPATKKKRPASQQANPSASETSVDNDAASEDSVEPEAPGVEDKGRGPYSLTSQLEMIEEALVATNDWLDKDDGSGLEIAIAHRRIAFLAHWVEELSVHVRVDHSTGVEYVDSWRVVPI